MASSNTAGDVVLGAPRHPNDVQYLKRGKGVAVGLGRVSGGVNTRVLYDNNGFLGEYSISGSGSVMMNNNPTITGRMYLDGAAQSVYNSGGYAVLDGLAGVVLQCSGANSIVVGAGSVGLPAVVNMPNIPDADPHIAGQIYSNLGILTKSAG